MTPTSPNPHHARIATMWLFFTCGAAYATWGIHVPTIQHRFSLSEALLSLAMFAVAGGAIIAMPKVGRAIAAIGSARASYYSGLLLGLTLVLLLLMPSFSALLPLLLVFGVANAGLDVAMNAQAITVEKSLGKPIMSTLHGMFSLGGMAGAAAGGMVLNAGISAVQHCMGMGLLVALSGWLAARFLLLDPPATASASDQASTSNTAKHLVWALGGLAFLGLIAEGGMYDWSVIYLRDEASRSAASSSIAYAAFSAGMALGRFGGDYLRARHGGTALLRYSAALSFMGMMLALIWPHWATGGFMLVGLGAANLIPVLFAAGARVPGISPAEGIAGVARLAYIGLLLGPVLIGTLAQLSNLRIGLGLIALCTALIGLLAHRALRMIAQS